MKRLQASLTTAWVVLLFSCGGNTEKNQDQSSAVESQVAAPSNLSYAVINSYPHDTAAFTQGLEVYQNGFIESTGLFGRSSLRRVDILSGKISKNQKQPPKYDDYSLTKAASHNNSLAGHSTHTQSNNSTCTYPPP